MQTFIDKAEIGATVTVLSKAWARGRPPLRIISKCDRLPGSECLLQSSVFPSVVSVPHSVLIITLHDAGSRRLAQLSKGTASVSLWVAAQNTLHNADTNTEFAGNLVDADAPLPQFADCSQTLWRVTPWAS
jgi:hypothetical protein